MVALIATAVWGLSSTSEETASSPAEREPEATISQASREEPSDSSRTEADGPGSAKNGMQQVPIAAASAALMAQHEARPPRDDAEFGEIFTSLRTLKARAGATEEEKALVRGHLTELCSAYIQGRGQDNRDARTYLGYVEFAHELPEELSFRGHPFLDAVEWATQKRWFGPEEAVELGLVRQAWTRALSHMKRITEEPGFELSERRTSALMRDKAHSGHFLTTLFDSPYLICHVSPQPRSPFVALALEDVDARRKQLPILAERAKATQAILRRVAHTYGQLHAEYMRRFAEPLGLKPLMSPWGGRPDLTLHGGRSFRDGALLTVICFDDADTFEAYAAPRGLPLGVTEWYSPASRQVVMLLSAHDGSPSETGHVRLLAGSWQLQDWFNRQRNRWVPDRPSRDFFRAGFAHYFGSAKRAADGTLSFHGLDRVFQAAMRERARESEASGASYPLFPLKSLVTFTTDREVEAFATRNGMLAPRAARQAYREQSWALIYFLATSEDARMRKGLLDFHELIMARKASSTSFGTVFGLASPDAWQKLEAAFHAFIKDTLLKEPLK